MRRSAASLVTVLALLLALGAAAGASAQGGSATLTPAGDAGAFPERSWLLSLPGGKKVHPDRVAVREDGRDVRSLRVVPADISRRSFGTVLVLDASESMRGRPIRDAMAAARAFAARRSARQSLGVVTFNGPPKVLLEPTTDARAIDAALAQPPDLAPKTAISDAVAEGLRVLRYAGVRSGSVVVLSDGADTASERTVDEVVAAASRQRVRVFGVGLESGAFSPDSLKRLAEGTEGSYSLATSGRSLRRLFDALGSRLAGELLLDYQSLEPAGSIIEVTASVPGEPRARATYEAPARRLAAPAQPTTGGFWLSAAGIVLVALVVGGLLASALALGLRHPPRERLRRRMAAFGPGTERAGGTGVDATEGGTPLGGVYRRVQGSLASRERWQRFEGALDVARVSQTPMEVASRTVLGSLIGFGLPLALGAGIPAGLVLAGLVPLCVRAYVKIRLRRQRLLFADQLADSLQVMASALRAGHSLAGALGSVVEDAPEPTRTEFARVRADERIGVPVEECITRMAQRMDNRDLQQVAIVAQLQQQTGGNTAEVLDRVVDSVRERADLRRLVRTLTAQGRMAHIVITALPIGIAVYIFVVNRDYIQPLFEPGAGRILVGLALAMCVVGSLIIRRIVDIKV